MFIQNITKIYDHNLVLVRDKIQRLNEAINNVDKDIEDDIKKIIDIKIKKKDRDDLKDKIFKQIDKKLMINLKIDCLKEGIKELEDLEHQLELKKKLLCI